MAGGRRRRATEPEIRKLPYMKSQRRHELQYNILDQKLTDLLAWLKKYSTYIAWGVTLVVVAVAITFIVRNSSEKKRLAGQGDYDQALRISDDDARLAALRKIADEEGDPFITAQATEKVAEEYARRINASEGRSSNEDLLKLNDLAKEYYQRVASNFESLDSEPRAILAAQAAHRTGPAGRGPRAVGGRSRPSGGTARRPRPGGKGT